MWTGWSFQHSATSVVQGVSLSYTIATSLYCSLWFEGSGAGLSKHERTKRGAGGEVRRGRSSEQHHRSRTRVSIRNDVLSDGLQGGHRGDEDWPFQSWGDDCHRRFALRRHRLETRPVVIQVSPCVSWTSPSQRQHRARIRHLDWRFTGLVCYGVEGDCGNARRSDDEIDVVGWEDIQGMDVDSVSGTCSMVASSTQWKMCLWSAAVGAYWYAALKRSTAPSLK